MYVLFAGSRYYPKGGFLDFNCADPSLEFLLGRDKVVNWNKDSDDWWHIIDIYSGGIVRSSRWLED